MATPMQGLIGSPHPSISVILPVLNEQSHVKNAVLSILAQDYKGPIEVILAMGPSKDKTLEIAEGIAASDSRVVLVNNPTGKTASGLNLALAQSTNPVVVRVDAHAEIPSNYLSLVVEVLNETGAVNVGGVMAAVGTTAFEKSVAGAMRSAFGVGASRFHTGGEAGAVDTVYLGAFRREALIAIGGPQSTLALYTLGAKGQDWPTAFKNVYGISWEEGSTVLAKVLAAEYAAKPMSAR